MNPVRPTNRPGIAGAVLVLSLLSTAFATAQQEPSLESVAEAAATKAQEATLFPVPDYGGDFWTRPALTGDWADFRQQLADDGIQFEFKLNQFYQGVVDGGRVGGSQWEYGGTTDYRIRIDTGKAGWWPGGFIEIHGETYYGDSVNGNTGAILPVNTDHIMSIPEGSGNYLSHVIFTQFLSEEFAVFAGKLDTTIGDGNSLAHIGNRNFQNLGFSVNPVLLAVGPYSTLGAGFVWLPTEEIAFVASAYDLEGEINTSGFDSVFEEGTGYSAELTVNTDFFGLPGHQLFGGIYADGDFFALSQDPRILLPILGVAPSVRNESWSAYYNFEQYLVHDADNDRGWGLFGRVGVADKATNPIPLFLSVGIGGDGLIPGRENDRFGVGFYHLEVSDDLPQLLLEGSEKGIEVFYDVEVTPWCRLAASLQIIEPALRTADTATVLGLRSTITF